MKKIVLFRADELPVGEVRRVEIEGRRPIAVYNLDGEFFATDDGCTHGTASLAEGFVENGQIICPFHSGAFDIRTGVVTVAPCSKALATHPVSVDDGVVQLIDEPAVASSQSLV